MLAASTGTEARIRTLAETVVARAGYDLVDIEYRREPGGWKVRLFIDKPGGVNLDDCQAISHEFGTILEVEDPIPHHYTLEVSSPGLDRPLTREEDFPAAVGHRVRIVTRRPISGRRNYAGRVVSADRTDAEGLILVISDDSGERHSLPVSGIERARLVHEWPETAGAGPRSRKAGSERRNKPGTESGRK